MYQIEFTTVHSYSRDRERISVPVVLKAGENSVRLAASIDTGATYCMFRNELAEALGLDAANAAPKRFRTANSSFEAFGHEVEISVLGVTTFSTVYFFADALINKNVLGRVGAGSRTAEAGGPRYDDVPRAVRYGVKGLR
jgi:predicted aspartyl protease